MKRLVIALFAVGLYGQTLIISSSQQRVKSKDVITYTITYNGTNVAALQWDIQPTYTLNWTAQGAKTLYSNARKTRFVYVNNTSTVLANGPVAKATWTVPKQSGQYKLTLTNVKGSDSFGNEVVVQAAAR